MTNGPKPAKRPTKNGSPTKATESHCLQTSGTWSSAWLLRCWGLLASALVEGRGL